MRKFILPVICFFVMVSVTGGPAWAEGNVLLADAEPVIIDDVQNYEEFEEENPLAIEADVVLVKDPLEAYNRVMFAFNDKFYYYFFKPVYTGYSNVIPEPARKSVNKFYTNLTMPIRFFNCLFQGKFQSAGTEMLRFSINSTLGIAGLFDPAKSRFHLDAQEEDFGQTLSKCKMGPGTYIVWPFIGPSNVRDTVGLVGDIALNPITWITYLYLNPLEGFGIRAFDTVNTGSLEAEDAYEGVTKAALDPYVALQDAYVKNRSKKINE
ncbi:MAG: VacJ family lipoprotein [Candidatus Brocadiaceae bacterium]|nr:VacJ family lipoprotein [Candidatus Brocadiaceae bacterium]